MRYDFEKKENEGFPESDNRWIWRLMVMILTGCFAVFMKLSCQDMTQGCATICADINSRWDGTAERKGLFSVSCGCVKVKVQRGTEFRLP